MASGDLYGASIGSVMDFASNSILANSANAKSKRASMRELWINNWLMDKQNEYNKPINQMKRLSEAGLNPNLVYGGGASTLSASAGHISRDNVTPSSGKLDVFEKMSMLKTMRQQEANLDKTNAEIAAINSNIEISRADLGIREHMARLAAAKNVAEIASLTAGTRSKDLDNEGTKTFKNLLYTTLAAPVTWFTEPWTKFNERMNSWYNRHFK